MEHVKKLRTANKQLQFASLQMDSQGFSYVRIDSEGKIIAVFDDDSELDVNELFSVSILDD